MNVELLCQHQILQQIRKFYLTTLRAEKKLAKVNLMKERARRR